jgi:hypothetical protein
MSQNLISLNLSEADFAEIDGALGTLETKLAGLLDLNIDERRGLSKMGDKSEAFCRQTLTVLAQNPQVIPPSLDLAEAQRDLANLDALRSRSSRLRQLIGRLDDAETALGSDVMSASLEGYALLKVLGKGSGLEALRQDISARFARAARAPKSPATAN